LDTNRPESRRNDIIEQAMLLFGERGYARTSMRDIAAAAGMLAGSVYYHFPSKEALLAAVYERGIDQSIAALEDAISGVDDPWDRLEEASAAHLRLLLASRGLAAVVMETPGQPGVPRDEYVRQRDRYEAVFRSLIAALPLPEGVGRGPFRLALLGALNWALNWYRPEGDPPDKLARDLFAVFRASKPATTETVTER
jgi:TetR/AcrR family transcriptional regulator, cholesterol catabolism regulator